MGIILTQEMDDEGKFKDLALENEILKLKMQAEMGASFFTETSIPPEIEALFLKQVIEFEEKYQQASMVPIYKLIGSPSIRDYRELSNQEIKTATQDILNLLEAKAIRIEARDVDPVRFYRFLTEELLFEKSEDMMIEGMIKYFDFYEFHDEDEKESDEMNSK